MRILNLGILAHVDAGKTTLTERLLYAAGVIDEIGSVDKGTTQTDSLDLERRRGITIKAAVVSFVVGDVTVNLIDTPGHPDFIAEVERVLRVLDAAFLVISAVEGVQPQTLVLMRALRRLQIPTLLFVNKIDRRGAQDQRVLKDIADRLTPAIVPMGSVLDIGTRQATFSPYDAADAAVGAGLMAVLGDHDEALLAAYLENGPGIPRSRLHAALASQTKQALVHPVFFGSAITGAGLDALMSATGDLLPSNRQQVEDPVSGTVFKVDRGPTGEKVAYIRMVSGTLRARQRIPLGDDEGKVTSIRVFEHGADVPRPSVAAGQIAKLWGLEKIRIGDVVGAPQTNSADHLFAPPTLETAIVPRRRTDKGALRVALDQLAGQDPLINLRQDDVRQEIYVSLYGEVQKEVIEETLANDFGIEVEFRETATICIERPRGTGAAVEVMHTPTNPILATIGLRIDPAPIGSGVAFRLEVELGSMPFAFFKAVEDTVHQTLRQGLHGWEVTDCTVTMTHSGYAPRQSHAHQGFSRAMSSTGADFRNLTPLVLMGALRRARTKVCEPVHRFQLEIPHDVLGAVLPALTRAGAVPGNTVVRGRSCLLAGEIPAAHVHALRQQLPKLTRGEAVLEASFDHYTPVRGAVPERQRTDNNPLNRKEYLRRVLRRPQSG